MDKITYFGEKVKENNWPDYCKSASNSGFDEKDQYSFADQFPWPPRHYTCTFCRRKFKSAQALGGHMNVHRRDRAMLRQPPPWVLQFPNNYPNPNSNSSPKNRVFIHPSVSSSSLSSTSLSHVADNNILALPPQPSYNKIYVKPKSLMTPPYLATKHGFASSGLKEFGKEGDEFKAMKNGQNGSRLDLELGLVRNKDQEDLDLELRLGYSTT